MARIWTNNHAYTILEWIDMWMSQLSIEKSCLLTRVIVTTFFFWKLKTVFVTAGIEYLCETWFAHQANTCAQHRVITFTGLWLTTWVYRATFVYSTSTIRSLFVLFYWILAIGDLAWIAHATFENYATVWLRRSTSASMTFFSPSKTSFSTSYCQRSDNCLTLLHF